MSYELRAFLLPTNSNSHFGFFATDLHRHSQTIMEFFVKFTFNLKSSVFVRVRPWLKLELLPY
jgi:hypothetical protein